MDVNAYNALQASKQMAFQERMSNTAHQREVRDLQLAGLNPVLSAGGSGASTPAGAMSQAEGDSTSFNSAGAVSQIVKEVNQGNKDTIKAVADVFSAVNKGVNNGASAAAYSIPKGSVSGLDKLLSDDSALQRTADIQNSLAKVVPFLVAAPLLFDSAGIAGAGKTLSVAGASGLSNMIAKLLPYQTKDTVKQSIEDQYNRMMTSAAKAQQFEEKVNKFVDSIASKVAKANAYMK